MNQYVKRGVVGEVAGWKIIIPYMFTIEPTDVDLTGSTPLATLELEDGDAVNLLLRPKDWQEAIFSVISGKEPSDALVQHLNKAREELFDAGYLGSNFSLAQ